MQGKKSCSTTKASLAVFVTWFLTSIIATGTAQAQTFKVLHTFHGNNGASPIGVLVRDAAGNLYGTTAAGGAGKCSQQGCGTVFKLDKTGKQLWVYDFQGKNGFSPSAGLLRDANGHLFGTTVQGGDTNCDLPYGCGTVFKLNGKTGKGPLLHKFTGPPDGWFPESLLVRDATGNLYGTTYLGGVYGLGAVFKIDTTGNETVLYSFTGGSDGCAPYTGVILDSAGNLYGVTQNGGAGFCNSGYGVVFNLDTDGNLNVLHTFGGNDGAIPDSVLLFDSQGSLYGTTAEGGSSLRCGDTGCGTVFQLSRHNGGWSESVLYSFCSIDNCADGEEPGTGPLVLDTSGNLFGTTYFGGTNDDGAVFKLDASGKETVLHSFTGGSGGAFPFAGLTMSRSGILYGTTQQGGATCYKSFTCGVVFKISP